MKEKKLLNKERRRQKNGECVEEREDTEDYTYKNKELENKMEAGSVQEECE
jgi:hypothetical protein